MRLRAYTLYDVKSVQHHAPFYAPTDGSAIRLVTDLVNDLNTIVGRHPSDHVLYYVGEWDDEKGVFTPSDIKVHVRDVISLVRPTQVSDLFGDDRTANSPVPGSNIKSAAAE